MIQSTLITILLYCMAKCVESKIFVGKNLTPITESSGQKSKIQAHIKYSLWIGLLSTPLSLSYLSTYLYIYPRYIDILI